ncbi:MAG: peptidoglycan editing factor PgeF [Ignavibacteriales bacterium]|nr:MAG: peptidoglycan editing factor PgeF [Ignavibacteriales bacterium]
MQIIKSSLFQKFPEIIFGLSTKIGLDRTEPFYFNMSLTVGDDREIVRANREAFYNELGLTTEQIAIQKQIHSDIITIVGEPGLVGESDAMITTQKGIGLAISTADCTPIFIYDRNNQIIAAVHSGWRGTEKQILRKTILILLEQFNCSPNDLLVYIGPSICQKNYEVGDEVAKHFHRTYIKKIDHKLFLDLLGVNKDVLLDLGIHKSSIEISSLCSYEEKYLQSYRRDGKRSGRALGLIAMREK